MFQDIFTKDTTLDKEEKEAGYALLCKYIINNINDINDDNVKEHICYWIAKMVEDGISKEQITQFKKELKGYIPKAIH